MADVVIDEVKVDEVIPPVVDKVIDTPEVPEVVTDKLEDVKEPVVKKVEEPAEEKISDDLTGLKAEIAKLQADLATAKANGDSKAALDQVNNLLAAKDTLVSDYEGILGGIVQSKLADVPENFKDLVPVNLSLKEQLDWLTKCEKAGIFKQQGNPDIEIGKPLNPNNKQTTDTSKLSASAIMALAYGNSKGRGKK